MGKNKILGVSILGVGVVLLGNVLNFWDISLFFDGWWTLFIIIPSLYGYFKKQWVSSTASLSVGVFLLLSANDIVSWEVVFPVILIMIGVSFLFKQKPNIDEKSSKDYIAIFSGNENKIESELNDMSIMALFGGVELDMRTATLYKDITIECTCLFGGVDILTPENSIVIIKGVPIFGGVENNALKGNGNTITINVTCLFGGVEIK